MADIGVFNLKGGIMGMLSDRMCGGDGFGEARKEGYAFGPYVANLSTERRKQAIEDWKEENPGAKLSDAYDDD